MLDPAPAADALGELLVEDGEMPGGILTHCFHQRDVRTAAPVFPSLEADSPFVFLPGRQVRHQLDPKGCTRPKHAMYSLQRGSEIPLSQQRLRTPYAAITAEKAAAGNGSARMSPRTRDTRPLSRARRTRPWARDSIAADRSIPT